TWAIPRSILPRFIKPLRGDVYDRARRRLLIVNRLHAELAGLPCEQLIGMRVADLNEEVGRNVELDFRHFDKGLYVPDHELVIGDRVYLVSTSPVHDGSGKVVAISLAHIDITEKRAMERRNERV